MFKYSAVIVVAFAFILQSFCEENSKIISTYAASWGAAPASGWRHLTNGNSEIGRAETYQPLKYIESEKVYASADNKLKSGARDGIVPAHDADRTAQYAISAYTFQNDFADGAWITNGNLQCRGGEDIDVKVYLNNTLKYSASVKVGRKPLLFQNKIGKIKKGDTLYVAVASATGKRNLFRLYYTIEAFIPGKEPKAPVPIISPDITEAVPQLEANGRVADSYLKNHNGQCEAALKIKPDIIFIGDSITVRWGQDMFAKYFSNYKCANFAIGGDWVQNVLWRLENGVIDKIKPKVVVLLIGTNNVTHGFTADEIATGIQAIVKLVNQKSPDSKFLLMGIFPRGESINNNPGYETIKKVNEKLAQMTDNKKIYYMDIGAKLVEPDGSITTEMMKDHLHIGPKGYEIWGTSIAPLIDRMMENN